MQPKNSQRPFSITGSLTVVFQFVCLFGINQTVFAHTPHHAIDAMRLSPAYQQDSTVFIIVQNTLLRSADRGTSWKQLIHGLDSAHVLSSITVSPRFSRDDTLFVSTDGGGVYASADRGQSFQRFNAGLRDGRVGMLEIVLREEQLVVLAAGSSRGMFVSSLAKADWQRVISDDVQITAIESVGDNGDGYVLAGDATGGVWKSSADLREWQRVFKVDGSTTITALAARRAPGAADTIYIGTDNRGLLRTVDYGLTFDDLSHEWPQRTADCNGRALQQPLPESRVRDITIADRQADMPEIVVSTWHKGVFASEDDGKSWSVRNAGLSCDKQADEPGFQVPQFRDLDAEADQDWFLAGFNGLFRSENFGESWTMLDTMPVSLIRGFDVSVSSTGDHAIAVATYGGGAYVSRNDGRSWSIANHGLRTTRLADLQFSVDGELFALAKERLLVSKDPAEPWNVRSLVYRGWRKRIGAGLERRVGFSPRFGTKLFLSDAERINPWPMQIGLSPDYASDQTIFVGLRSYGVWKTENAGIDWERNWEEPVDYVTTLQVSPDFSNDQTVVAGIRGSGIIISNDAAETWHLASDGFRFMESLHATESPNYINDPPLQRAISDVVLSISPDFAADRTLLAGSSSGLFRSTDAGESWSEAVVTSSQEDVPIRAIAFSPAFRDDGIVVVSLKGRGLFRSIDKGESFAATGEGLLEENHELKFIEFSANFDKNDVIFGASDEAVLMSRDNGVTWAVIDRPVRYEDWRGAGEGPIRFSTGWSRETGAQFSASSQTVSDETGAVSTLVFIGNDFTWLGERCPDCGNAEVLVDGETIVTVDLFSDQKGTAEILTVTDLDNGPHVLQIEVRGTKNDRSGGHRVTIDAISVSGR